MYVYIIYNRMLKQTIAITIARPQPIFISLEELLSSLLTFSLCTYCKAIQYNRLSELVFSDSTQEDKKQIGLD